MIPLREFVEHLIPWTGLKGLAGAAATMRRLVFSVFALPLLLSCSDKTKVTNSLDSGAKRDSSMIFSDPVKAIDNYAERRQRAYPLAALYKATDGPWLGE